MKGSYLYDMVLPLVDYCGDIKGKRQTYSQYYSPNNIRRLYLSPDGAMVMYHVNAGKGLRKTVSFNGGMVQQCEMCADYVPMLYVLSADRVCASIEEVVICQRGDNGAVLDQREMDFMGLVKSYKGSGSDLKDTIMNRYKRLHSFMVYSGSIKEFLASTGSYDSALRVLTDSEFVQRGCSVEIFHDNDWYKGYGSSAQFYMLDRQGSPLNEHFKKVLTKITEQQKEADLDNFKKERVKGVQAEFDTKYEQALQIIKGYTRLRKLEAEHGQSFLGGILPKEMFLTLAPVDNLGKKPNLVRIDELKKMGLKEALTYNKGVCEEYSMKFYTYMVQALLDTLIRLQAVYPTMVMELLSDMDRAIRVPPQLESINQSLCKPLKGTRWLDSVANLCWFLNLVCVVDNEYDSKERWMKCIS